MLSERLSKVSWTPRRVCLTPQRQNLPGSARILSTAEKAAKTHPVPPPLPLSLWLAFSEKGDRTAYETPYFARRSTLTALTMGEWTEGKKRYLRLIGDYIWAICEETAWQLPAHNNYVRDTVQLPLPDPERPIVDLFAAETGALLSMVPALLEDPLEDLSPGISERIRKEIRTRILDPCKNTHFWWMADTNDPKDRPVCNWTPWCTQNMLLCANAAAADEELPFFVQKAAGSLDSFINSYGKDGCCNEGAQYYSHAALPCFYALELLCSTVPGVLDTIWQEKKLLSMAEYILHMHVEGPWYLNFSDCSPLAGPRGAGEFLFAKKVKSPGLMALAAGDVAQGSFISQSLYEDLRFARAEEEILAAARTFSKNPPPPPGDVWYPSTGILVTRRGKYVLGAKAGNNGDSHNHNDVGSVTLYKDGSPLLIDVGVETYTRDTFSSKRYTIWTMQSSWHNLPEFDPEGEKYQQLPGPEYCARDVNVKEDLSGIRMDLSGAYGTVPGLTFYRREATLTPEGFTLHDRTDYPGLTALTLMSSLSPAIRGCTVAFGDLAKAGIQGNLSISREEIPVTDPRLRTAWPETLYRTRIYFKGELQLTLT